MIHRYISDTGDPRHKGGGCLEDHFIIYKVVGTLFEENRFQTQYAKWKPFVKDMRKMGFILYAERVVHKNARYVFVYAKRKDYPTSAAFGTAVCITRYMYKSLTQYNRWLNLYKKLRKNYGVTLSVYLSDIYEVNINKSFVYAKQACKPRKKLVKDKRRRQSGESVFTYKTGFGNSINFNKLKGAIKEYRDNPTYKNKKLIDKWL